MLHITNIKRLSLSDFEKSDNVAVSFTVDNQVVVGIGKTLGMAFEDAIVRTETIPIKFGKFLSDKE